MNLREKITNALNEIVENWPNVGYNQLDIIDSGFLIANGQCDTFATEAVWKLKNDNIVDPKDITVVVWKNDHILAHTCLLIHGRFYDSAFREGKKVTRESLNDLFASYIYRIKVFHPEERGVLVENVTNKILFNPWPREGVAYTFYTEYRHNGEEWLNR